MTENFILVGFLMIALLIILRVMHKKVKRNKLGFQYVFFNFALIFIMIFLLIIYAFFAQNIENLITRFTGISSLVIFSLMVSVALLFYNSFLQELKIATLTTKVESIVRNMAIDKDGDDK